MSKGLIAKKVGMTSVFAQDGRLQPVTVIEAGPCVVTQIKTEQTDGYNALQLGFGPISEKKLNKPASGHMKKSGGTFSILREMPVDDPEQFTVGQSIGADLFQVGDRVDVVGTTKGRGFQGVMKRHRFAGGRDTHGSKNHRVPGSIGCSAWPGRVFKGKRMPGQYGGVRHTVRNLEVVDIRPDQNLILLKGSVPGSKSGTLMICKPKFSS